MYVENIKQVLNKLFSPVKLELGLIPILQAQLNLWLKIVAVCAVFPCWRLFCCNNECLVEKEFAWGHDTIVMKMIEDRFAKLLILLQTFKTFKLL